MPELMKLESTKSMMRYLPPNGTAGLERSLVSGYRRSPLPPAMMMPMVFISFPLCSADGVHDLAQVPAEAQEHRLVRAGIALYALLAQLVGGVGQVLQGLGLAHNYHVRLVEAV